MERMTFILNKLANHDFKTKTNAIMKIKNPQVCVSRLFSFWTLSACCVLLLICVCWSASPALWRPRLWRTSLLVISLLFRHALCECCWLGHLLYLSKEEKCVWVWEKKTGIRDQNEDVHNVQMRQPIHMLSIIRFGLFNLFWKLSKSLSQSMDMGTLEPLRGYLAIKLRRSERCPMVFRNRENRDTMDQMMTYTCIYMRHGSGIHLIE